MQLAKGTRVTDTRQTWAATVLQIKNTPSGQSVKVQRDDRKIASWYWASDLTPAS